MKRLISVLIIMTMVVSFSVMSAPALALDLDLSALSDDELLELNTVLKQELVDRGLVKTSTIPAGRYIGGRDIPTGTYVIVLESEIKYGNPYVILFPDDSYDKSSTQGSLSYASLKQGDSAFISIEAGNMLYVSHTMRISVFTGIDFG